MTVWKVYIDGASRGQGTNIINQAALGVVITKNDKVAWTCARGLGSVTNNVAEYEALLTALLMCWSTEDIKDPLIYSDSQLVVNQVNGVWACTTRSLIPLHHSVKVLARDYRFRLFKVPRKMVEAADQLANQFLDELISEHPTLVIPTTRENTIINPPPI